LVKRKKTGLSQTTGRDMYIGSVTLESNVALFGQQEHKVYPLASSTAFMALSYRNSSLFLAGSAVFPKVHVLKVWSPASGAIGGGGTFRR
jgi:hypothetical protein